MKTHISDAVSEQIGHAQRLYHRLVLVVGRQHAGKTEVLRSISERIDAPLVNVNLELSRRMLDVTEGQRPRQVHPLLERIIAETDSDIVLLDNMELLFDIVLRQDPLRLLQGLSRNRTVVAAWNGSVEEGHIHYAVPGHPEYRRYATDEVLVVSAEQAVK